MAIYSGFYADLTWLQRLYQGRDPSWSKYRDRYYNTSNDDRAIVSRVVAAGGPTANDPLWYGGVLSSGAVPLGIRFSEERRAWVALVVRRGSPDLTFPGNHYLSITRALADVIAGRVYRVVVAESYAGRTARPTKGPAPVEVVDALNAIASFADKPKAAPWLLLDRDYLLEALRVFEEWLPQVAWYGVAPTTLERQRAVVALASAKAAVASLGGGVASAQVAAELLTATQAAQAAAAAAQRAGAPAPPSAPWWRAEGVIWAAVAALGLPAAAVWWRRRSIPGRRTRR